jgi:hypothetical protein
VRQSATRDRDVDRSIDRGVDASNLDVRTYPRRRTSSEGSTVRAIERSPPTRRARRTIRRGAPRRATA